MKAEMESVWEQLEHTHQNFAKLVGQLKSGDSATRLSLIQHSRNRVLVAQILDYLGPEDLKGLMPFLISEVRGVHGYLDRFRRVILSLPKDWLSSHIEAAAEPFLESGGDEEYRRFLELYFQIDNNLAKKLALRASRSSNQNIREVGEEFMERLGKT